MNKQTLRRLTYNLVVFSLVLFLVETIFQSGWLKSNFGLSANIPLLLIIFGILGLVYIGKVELSERFIGAVGLVGLGSTLLTMIGFLVDYKIQPNIFFSQTHIFVNELFFAGMYYSFLYILLYGLKSVKQIVYFFPVYFFTVLLMVRIYHFNSFFIFTGEDGPLESTQFFLFVLAAILSFFIAVTVRKMSVLISALFGLAGLGFLGVAGEEISWGQRLLDLKTPDHLKVQNTQEELNVHNNVRVFGYVYRAYLAISAYGLLSWMGVNLFSRITSKSISWKWKMLVPSKYLSLYFLSSTLYFYYRVYLDFTPGMSEWEEVVEVLLVLGIVLHLITCSISISELKKSKNRLINKMVANWPGTLTV